MGKPRTARLSRKKLAVNLSLIVIACLIIIIEINIFYNGLNAVPQKSDVVIVLGCSVWGDKPSPTLQERIDRAFELYQSGYADRIIASGSKGFGENIEEAVVIKRELVKMGVPGKHIIEEKESTNTVENLTFSKALMRKHGLESALIVTNYYHIYRSSMIARDLNMTASFGKARMPQSKVTLVLSNVREIASVLKYFIIQTFSKFSLIMYGPYDYFMNIRYL